MELGADSQIPSEMPVDADWGDVFDEGASGASKSGADSDELRDFLEANLHSSKSLHDYLVEQARTAPFTLREAELAEHLIDSINDDGYLDDWDELAARLRTEYGATS